MKSTYSKDSDRFAYLIILVITLWIIEGVNSILGHRLNSWGILPRTAYGLKGIPLFPLLHVNISHLVVNTGPLIILGGLISLYSKWIFIKTTSLVTLICGSLVWLIGRPAYHVGASGLIFGYLGYLIFKGIFAKNIKSIILSIITFFAYGGIIWGILPTDSYISWEGHLSGFLAGIMVARLEAKPIQ